MANEVFAKSIDRRWRRALREYHGRVLVFSPYLTSPTANTVLGLAKPGVCEIHTVMSLENFANGASSFRTVRHLYDSGYKLFDVESLHAKVLLLPGHFASVGSQNLTSQGTKNLEASIAVTSINEINAIEQAVQPWVDVRRPIDRGTLDDIECCLPPLKRAMRALRTAVSDGEQALVKAQAERERIHKAREEQFQSQMSRLHRLVASREASLATAQLFIGESTWWLTRKQGPVQARAFANRVEDSENGWRVFYGANQFLVGRAIQRCVAEARSAIEAFRAGATRTRADLVAKLRYAVACSVAKQSGDEYNGPYPITEGVQPVIRACGGNADA